MPQAGLDLWEVRSNRTKMRGTALTALEPLVFPRISTEIGLVRLAPAVDGMALARSSSWAWASTVVALGLGQSEVLRLLGFGCWPGGGPSSRALRD